jgi:hypothetical protein
MADDKSIDIKSIVKRFSESSDALDGLKEQMSALTATAESLSKMSAGTSEMVGQMRNFVSEASRVTVMLKGATEKVQSAVERAVGALDGGGVADIKSDLRQVRELLEQQLKATQVELAKVREEARLATVELANLTVKISKLPDKVKRKYWSA